MLKGVLHIHSHLSFDSVCRPAAIVNSMRRNGCSFFAVSDHGTNMANDVLVECSNRHNLICIPAVEVSTAIGDLIVLFAQVRNWNDKDPVQLIEAIHQEQGLVLLPHPGKNLNVPPDEITAEVDLIEVFNPRLSARENKLSLELARNFDKPPVVGSDAHFAFEIGLTCNEFMVPTTQVDLKEILLKMPRVLHGTQEALWCRTASECIGALTTKNYTKGMVSALATIKHLLLHPRIKTRETFHMKWCSWQPS